MLSKLLDPRSVAVVGASDDVDKMRGKILHCLLGAGFGGAVYPVNPGRDRIQGLPAYPDIASLPEAPDLVLIAVPGAAVPAVVEAASARGCGAAILFSADVEPEALARAAEAARRAGMRLLGPNTQGLYVPGAHLAPTFAAVVEARIVRPVERRPAARPITVISQSGAIGFALYGRGVDAHLDIDQVITTGNEADLECLDFVEHVVDSDRPRVVLLFVEGFKSARRFAGIADKAARRGMALVVMKVGSSEAGQRATLSHTAHLAGADSSYDALFERYGVFRVEDVDEMLATAAALSRLAPMKGRRVAIVTTSGGAGGWAADLLAKRSLTVPVLSAGVQARLREHVVAFGTVSNPVDVTAHGVEHGASTMVEVIRALLSSQEVDAVLVNMGLANAGRLRGMRASLEPLLLEAGAMPVVFHSHFSATSDALAAVVEFGSYGFASFRACAAGLDALARFHQRRTEFARPSALATDGRSPSGLGALPPGGGVLDDASAIGLLQSYAIPTAPSRTVETLDDARAAAHALGYPVVLKIQSADIAHKTEAGGVELGVTEPSLETAWSRLHSTVGRKAPAARIDGVLVQKMMPPGHEMIVGVVNDADFGPLVMLGMGGIYVEILRDVVFEPPPLDRNRALAMIRRLKAVALLDGARGQAPADIDALADLIVCVGQLAQATDGIIDQLDFNPVLVYPRGEGVVVVDWLIARTDPLR